MRSMKVPLAQHEMTEVDIEVATAALRSSHLTRGPKLYEFERDFARFVGTKYAVAASSGTAALHIALRALGIGGGGAVITTPLSFIASSNCLLFENVRPVFVDVEPETFQLDPRLVEAKVRYSQTAHRGLRGILGVDLFGYIADWSALRAIADEYNLQLIEDSCEALGSRMQQGDAMRKAGAFGDVGVFGFFPNKQITTGEGGMLVTDDKRVNELARAIKNHGASPSKPWDEYEMLGYNYHITEVSSALGVSQLGRIDSIIARRAEITERYNHMLALCEDVITPPRIPGQTVSRFVYVLRLSEKYNARDRDALMAYLSERGITTRNYFPCIHLTPFYAQTFGYKRGDFPVAEGFADRSLALPFFHAMTDEQMDYVVCHLSNGLECIKQGRG